jgi:hypothetical protein
MAWIAAALLLQAADDVGAVLGPPPELDPGAVWTVPLDLSAEEAGLQRLQALEEAPVFFPTLSRIVFGAPAFAIEGVTALLPERLTLFDRRLYDRSASEDDLAWRMGRTWVHREISALGRLRDSSITPIEVELGLVEPDRDRLDRLQKKVLVDSFRRAGRERYAVAHLELDSALDITRTGGWLDYLIAPGLVTLYAARFGVERRFRLTPDVRVEVSIERGSKLLHAPKDDEEDEPVASVALNLFRLPVSAIVCVDRSEDGLELGFVGIGTDVHAAIEAVIGARGTIWKNAREDLNR